MSRQPYDGYVLNVVRLYPRLVEKLEEKRAAAMSLTMTEATLQTDIAAKMGEFSSDMVLSIAKAFNVDAGMLASAFDFELDEDELAVYDEYHKAMELDRNAQMAVVAGEYLQSGETVFYAVGLAHLLDETGLLEGLRAAGYTVEPVG